MSVCFHRLAAPGQLVLFAMGGTAYLALEIAWRGTTHWTMFLAGGACLCALDALGRLPLPTPLLAGIGAVGVSVLELGTGLGRDIRISAKEVEKLLPRLFFLPKNSKEGGRHHEV